MPTSSKFGNRAKLTTTASFGPITSLIGWAGLLLNNRYLLAVFLPLICLLTLGHPRLYQLQTSRIEPRGDD